MQATQDTMMLDTIRPFSKLAQENMAAFSAFVTAPEVVAQNTASMTQLLQRSTEAASAVSGSSAYIRLLQSLMQNYTEFLADFGRTAMQLAMQGQAALVTQAQEAGEAVAEAASNGSSQRRSRSR